MKKLVLALSAIVALLLGGAGIANAYPPSGALITVSNANPAQGEDITVTVDCGDGSDDSDSITVNLDDESETASCNDGSAAVTIEAPETPGTFDGEVLNGSGDRVGGFTITVVAPSGGSPTPDNPTTPSGGLPATGSNSSGTITTIAIGLLVVGLGLFAVATIRRRQPITA